MKDYYRLLMLVLVLIVLGGTYYFVDHYSQLSENIIVLEKDYSFKNTFNVVKNDSNENNEEKDNDVSDIIFDDYVEEPELITIPKTFNNKVPFTSQAPYADWSELYNEACEEASIIMFKYFLLEKDLNKEIANQEILKLVDWQNQVFNDFRDSDLEDVLKIIQDYYKQYNAKIIENNEITVDDLKYYLYNNGPIIAPMAGRLLKNKYFRGDGPLYHMLVITGYDKAHFITNDPGTRFGEGYRYKYDIILKSIHDLPATGKDDILKGRKAFIIIDK